MIPDGNFVHSSVTSVFCRLQILKETFLIQFLNETLKFSVLFFPDTMYGLQSSAAPCSFIVCMQVRVELRNV